MEYDSKLPANINGLRFDGALNLPLDMMSMLGSAEKHFSLIQITDIIYDSSWSAPTEGSQSASFSSKPLKNLALWCRK